MMKMRSLWLSVAPVMIASSCGFPPVELRPESPPPDASPPSLTLLAGGVGGAGNADGKPAEARFALPAGVAVDAMGNVYIADRTNHTIRKVDTVTGMTSTFAGVPGVAGNRGGDRTTALFNDPFGITIDLNGIMYIADFGN